MVMMMADIIIYELTCYLPSVWWTLSRSLTKKGPVTIPIMQPSGIERLPTVVAMARSSSANHEVATFEAALPKKGWKMAMSAYPTMSK